MMAEANQVFSTTDNTCEQSDINKLHSSINYTNLSGNISKAGGK